MATLTRPRPRRSVPIRLLAVVGAMLVVVVVSQVLAAGAGSGRRRPSPTGDRRPRRRRDQRRGRRCGLGRGHGDRPRCQRRRKNQGRHRVLVGSGRPGSRRLHQLEPLGHLRDRACPGNGGSQRVPASRGRLRHDARPRSAQRRSARLQGQRAGLAPSLRRRRGARPDDPRSTSVRSGRPGHAR